MTGDFMDTLWELYQQWELGSQQKSISVLKERVSRQRDRDSEQDQRIGDLERQNAQLILAFFSLVQTLKARNLLTQEELQALLDSARPEPPSPSPDPTSDGLTPELCEEPPAPE